jgi:hypothetical protein
LESKRKSNFLSLSKTVYNSEKGEEWGRRQVVISACVGKGQAIIRQSRLCDEGICDFSLL